MIRNVVVGRLRDEGSTPDATALDEGLAGIAALDLPGQLSSHVGRDVGLRAGGWSFAITNDWVDEAAYQAYDRDPEHNLYRAQIVAVCDEVARVQFAVPGQLHPGD